MNVIKHSTRIALSIVIVLSLLLSCKKDKNLDTKSGENGPSVSLPNCTENSGYFTININGEHFELVIDSETHYTNLYNWYNFQESAFVIYGKDQNANAMDIELALPGKFKLGSTPYVLDYDFFDIDVDTFSLYVSNVVFDVSTSNLGADGMYRPLKASFTGVAHSYAWINGQPPTDTFNISGTMCINGYIMN